MADTTAATGSTVDWGALLGQILTGGLGVAGAVNSGPLSATGNAATAAAAADPFAPQRGQYQGQLSTALGGGQPANQYGQMFNNAYNSQQNPSLGTFQTAQANQSNPYATQLNQLLTDPNSFKTDPGYQFALSQGQDAVKASANALYGGQRAGAITPELAKYTEGYAEQAYDTRLNQLGTLSNQQNSYNLGNLGALNTNAQVQGGINANNLSNISGMFGQQGSQNNQWIQSLLAASGAETGSPATAGSIIGGGFQTQNSNISDIIKALAGNTAGAGSSTGLIPSLIKAISGNSGTNTIGGSTSDSIPSWSDSGGLGYDPSVSTSTQGILNSIGLGTQDTTGITNGIIDPNSIGGTGIDIGGNSGEIFGGGTSSLFSGGDWSSLFGGG